MKPTFLKGAALLALLLLCQAQATQAQDTSPLMPTVVVPLVHIEPGEVSTSAASSSVPYTTPAVPDPVIERRVGILSLRLAEHLDGLILKQRVQGRKITRQVRRDPVAGTNFLIVTAQVRMPLALPEGGGFTRATRANPFGVARVEVRCPDGELLAQATQELDGRRVSLSKYERRGRYRISGMTFLLETFAEKALDGAFDKLTRETNWEEVAASAARCSPSAPVTK